MSASVATLVRLFDCAVRLPTGPERDDLLDRLCESDPDLRPELDRLLAAHGNGVWQVIGGFAMDMNNLLTVIAGYGELTRHGLETDHPDRKPLDTIQLAAERGLTLIRELSDHIRRLSEPTDEPHIAPPSI